ncbi:hypothetical protein ABZ722_34390 [Streptomyces longwoodensis]|uniref:hypothetical protein n=1 Tax=Streptomyces longwoodensis TaxID=68231 RepID=UPI0034014467
MSTIQVVTASVRSSFSSSDIGTVTTHLVQARRQFETAAQAEEARHDAFTYAAVCDAILAFGRAGAAAINHAADQITDTLTQHQAWLHRSHQPEWLQPRRSAEIAWHHLVFQLRAAATTLEDDAWMDAWQALNTVLAAYSAARTVCPLGDDTDQGLALLVQPAIEDGFLRQQAFLAQLRRAAQETDQHAARGFDTATASALLTAIETAAQRETSPAVPSNATDDGSDDDDPGGAALGRLQRLAPTLLLQLKDQALSIAGAVDDQQLLVLEGLAHDSDVARLKATDPLIVPTLDRLVTELSAHPSYTGEVLRPSPCWSSRPSSSSRAERTSPAPTWSAPPRRASRPPSTTGANPRETASPSKPTCNATSSSGSRKGPCATSSSSNLST